MNFQDLKKIEKYNNYLDLAIKNSKKELSKNFSSFKNKDKLEKQKKITKFKIETISKSINSNLNNITVSFPNIDSLPEFYIQLIRTQLDYVMLKKSLGSLNWAEDKINSFTKIYISKLFRDQNNLIIQKHFKEYLGRVSSVLNRIKKNLEYLEHSRKTMKSFPSVKSGLFTVALYGFPNVGKSTLLSKITTSKPKIDSYSFTTKTINIGYLKKDSIKIQVLDTPGTLNRKDKMNEIEMQAELCLKYVADLIVFVHDPSYDEEKQNKLLKKITKSYEDKQILKYVSKSDLYDDLPKDFIKDINILKKEIINFQQL
ncbi:MAG: GTPase, partial [Candidatus Woesearchaeota archaeon]